MRSITFTGSVNADANRGDGQEALTTNGGSTSIGGPIGNSQALGGLTVTATGMFNLPSASILGNLSITTTGDITQSGPANVTGTTGLSAGIGSITMAMANDFGGIVTAAGTGGISLNDINTLTPGVINAGSGSVILRASSLAGGGTVTGGTAEFSSNTNVSGLNINMANVPLNLTGSAQQWALTGVPTAPNPITVVSTSVTVTYNGATAVASLAQQQAANASATVTSAVAAVIVEEANKTFGTDSVAEDVEYGFAGEVGATPPMDHRIDESGISLPRCVTGEPRRGALQVKQGQSSGSGTGRCGAPFLFHRYNALTREAGGPRWRKKLAKRRCFLPT